MLRCVCFSLPIHKKVYGDESVYDTMSMSGESGYSPALHRVAGQPQWLLLCSHTLSFHPAPTAAAASVWPLRMLIFGVRLFVKRLPESLNSSVTRWTTSCARFVSKNWRNVISCLFEISHLVGCLNKSVCLVAKSFEFKVFLSQKQTFSARSLCAFVMWKIDIGKRQMRALIAAALQLGAVSL